MAGFVVHIYNEIVVKEGVDLLIETVEIMTIGTDMTVDNLEKVSA